MNWTEQEYNAQRFSFIRDIMKEMKQENK